MSNQLFNKNYLAENPELGTVTGFPAAIQAEFIINAAYGAAGNGKQIHATYTIPDGGAVPSDALDDSQVSMDMLPEFGSIVLGAGPNSINAVFLCDASNDGRNDFRIVNAAACYTAFKTSLATLQSLIDGMPAAN